MKKLLSIVSLLLIIVLMVGTMSITASANKILDPAEFIDISKTCSLEVTVKAGDLYFATTPVKIYKVADVDENLKYTVSSRFAKLPVDFSAIKKSYLYNSLAFALYGYVDAKKMQPNGYEFTDANGKAKFENLEPGMYLVAPLAFFRNNKNYYYNPFIIEVPFLNENHRWDYDVTVVPKLAYSCDKPKLDPEEYPLTIPEEKEEEEKKDDEKTDTPEQKQDNPTTNPTDKDLKIIINWDDEDDSKRPDTVDVDVYKDGKLYKTVKVNKKDNWVNTWTAPDDSSVWSIVVKANEDDYKALVDFKDDVFTATMTGKKSPKTGDNNAYALMVAVLALSFLSSAFVLRKIKE